jgi:prefoldin subunit 4
MLTASTEKIDADVSKLEDSLGDLREEMQQLKVALYARFGRSINLET